MLFFAEVCGSNIILKVTRATSDINLICPEFYLIVINPNSVSQPTSQQYLMTW